MIRLAFEPPIFVDIRISRDVRALDSMDQRLRRFWVAAPVNAWMDGFNALARPMRKEKVRAWETPGRNLPYVSSQSFAQSPISNGRASFFIQ